MNEKGSRERDSPPAAGRSGDIIPSRRSAILSGAFLFNRSYFGRTLLNKKNTRGACYCPTDALSSAAENSSPATPLYATAIRYAAAAYDGSCHTACCLISLRRSVMQRKEIPSTIVYAGGLVK